MSLSWLLLLSKKKKMKKKKSRTGLFQRRRGRPWRRCRRMGIMGGVSERGRSGVQSMPFGWRRRRQNEGTEGLIVLMFCCLCVFVQCVGCACSGGGGDDGNDSVVKTVMLRLEVIAGSAAMWWAPGVVY